MRSSPHWRLKDFASHTWMATGIHTHIRHNRDHDASRLRRRRVGCAGSVSEGARTRAYGTLLADRARETDARGHHTRSVWRIDIGAVRRDLVSAQLSESLTAVHCS